MQLSFICLGCVSAWSLGILLGDRSILEKSKIPNVSVMRLVCHWRQPLEVQEQRNRNIWSTSQPKSCFSCSYCGLEGSLVKYPAVIAEPE